MPLSASQSTLEDRLSGRPAFINGVAHIDSHADAMTERPERPAALPHEAGETHHLIYPPSTARIRAWLGCVVARAVSVPSPRFDASDHHAGRA
jgi:hypothetical protein